MFEYEGLASLPKTDRILNWDVLLSYVRKGDLLWSRLNHRGLRVGLVELLGIVMSPGLDGFSLTKDISRVGLPLLYDLGLCHHPRGIGELYARLRGKHSFPPAIYELPDFRGLSGKPVEECSEEEVLELLRRCDYLGRIPAFVEEYARRLFLLVRELLETFPAHVLFFHLGHFDRLLHLFYEQPEAESRVLDALDRVLDHLTDTFDVRDLVLFSDHGMRPSSPHAAGDVFHRTFHEPSRAVFAGSGPRIERMMAARPPLVLKDVYRCAVGIQDA
jgi:hypothetical protein